MTFSDTEAAKLALLVVFAMDMHTAAPTALQPAADPRLLPDWKLVGHITARDSLWRKGATMLFGGDTCYGFLAQNVADPTLFAAAIRGTNGIIEWLEDASFLPMPHPVAGKVESGFYGIYHSMSFRPLEGDVLPVASGIMFKVGAGRLICIGHSLGAPLAQFLTFDIATNAPDQVQGLYFASPRAGNAAFAKAFHDRVKTYQVFNYILDVVPHVPRGPDYTDLQGAMWISPHTSEARICFNLNCHHHLVCYASMLDFALLDWTHLWAADAAFSTCIKGPT